MNVADGDVRPFQDLGEEPTGPSIDVIDGEDFISGLEQARDCSDGGESAGKSKGARSVLQLRKLLFQNGTGGIAAAGIVILTEFEGPLLLEGSSLINRRGHRAMWVARTSC